MFLELNNLKTIGLMDYNTLNCMCVKYFTLYPHLTLHTNALIEQVMEKTLLTQIYTF